MRNFKKLFALILVLLVVLAVAACDTGGSKSSESQGGSPSGSEASRKFEGQEILVHSGAGISRAIDAVTAAFEKETGAKIVLNYAGCPQLLSQMEINEKGDVFVGGSLGDMEIAIEKGFTDSYEKIAYHKPAIGVPKGNPANIATIEDMAKDGVKLILGDAESNAIGKKAKKIFTTAGIYEAVQANVISTTATANELITHLVAGDCDAAIIWLDTGYNVEGVEVIEIPDEQNATDIVPVAKLNFTANAELAQAYIDFILSENGLALFKESGFEIID